MYVENTIKNFFINLKSTLNEFEYVTEELWSPNNDFEERLRSYIALKDVAQNLPKKEWICLVWNFRFLETPEHMGRPTLLANKDVNTLMGTTYLLVEKSITYHVSAFSNDMHYGIKFMEMFSVAYDRSSMFDVLYPPPLKALGLFPTQTFDLKTDDFRLLDRDKLGSMVKHDFSFNVNLPIVRQIAEIPLIGGHTDPFNPPNVIGNVYLNQNIPQVYIDALESEFVVI